MRVKVDDLVLPDDDLRASVDEDELDSLAASMVVEGQLQDIGVKATDDNRWLVIFGGRRTRAARLLRWTHLNAQVVRADHGRKQRDHQMIANEHYSDLAHA